MTLMQLAKKAEKFIVDNSPSILTTAGVTGTVITAVLTGKASFEAAMIIDRIENDVLTKTDQKLEPKEKVRLVWKLYIPPVIVGAGTVTSIICANRVGTRRAAALAAAYSVSERAYAEYREKVVERLGKNKEEEMRGEIAQQRVLDNPPKSSEVIIIDNGDVLFLESYTGRYFRSSIETVKKAMNDLNYHMRNDMYASLGDFQMRIGLPTTGVSEEVGWVVDEPLEIHFSATLTEDQKPCIVMEYVVSPVRNYHMFH